MSKILVTASIRRNVDCRLVVSANPDLSSPSYSSAETPVDNLVKLELTGLSADTQYYYGIEVDGTLAPNRGTFRTLPASGSFRVGLAADRKAYTPSLCLDAIAACDPNFLITLGDSHYQDVNTAAEKPHLEAYRKMMDGPSWGRLLRRMQIYDIWDDHDYCGDDTYSNATGKDGACKAFRTFWPHPTLENATTTDPIYYSLKVGRVVFLFTDLRSPSSAKGATDNSSKSMMGSTQKAWFKSVLADSANSDCLFVWINSRAWGSTTASGVDSWGGYNTERVELADYVQATCPGRFCVIHADTHATGIDDGSNHDFVTTGSEPIPTFLVSPIDHDFNGWNNTGTYSEGTSVGNGQFGIMDITDTGGSSIGVDWIAYDRDLSVLVSHSFSISV